MKTFSKILFVLTLLLALTAFVTPNAIAQCDPDVPFMTALPHPDRVGLDSLEAKVTYTYPWLADYYRHLHCGFNPTIEVDPCNPWTLEVYFALWEQKPGGDRVKLLPIHIPWNQDSCNFVDVEFIHPSPPFTYNQFSDSIVIKVTIKPHAILGCVGTIPYPCQMPPYQTVFLDCWVDCFDELLEMEGQDECTPPNSVICRVEWDKPLPVELTSFTSTVKDNTVVLNWTTASEKNNARFVIERMMNNVWTDIGSVAGNGTTSNINNYSFIDKNLNSGIYSYRLRQVDYNGNFEYFNLNGAVAIGVPNSFSLSQNYPNPFNPTTTILYGVPNDGYVTMKVFDNNGREVKTIVNEPKTAGYYTVEFNAAGLSSGVYFYKLESGNNVVTKKMVLMK